MNRMTLPVALLACASAALLQAAWAHEVPVIRIEPVVLSPTRVLVLGTQHLAALKQPLDAAALEPVISRLVAFHPDVIAVENISGLTCDSMARSPRYEPADFRRFCFDTSQASAATGLTVSAAATQLNALMKTWPANPSSSRRRHLIALALAAGEPATARLQWQELAPVERRAADGLTAGLVEQLDRRRSGEVDLLAIPVAARSGLARLLAMDDHTGDDVDVADSDAFLRAVQDAWRGGEKTLQAFNSQTAAFEGRRDTLGLYRYLNEPAVLSAGADNEVATGSRDTSPQHYGHMYVAGWETRNLRMAANIAEAIRDRPDARVLVIVGSGHKPWLDRILGQMANVEIVDAEAALR